MRATRNVKHRRRIKMWARHIIEKGTFHYGILGFCSRIVYVKKFGIWRGIRCPALYLAIDGKII
jgi:hypothetical protein